LVLSLKKERIEQYISDRERLVDRWVPFEPDPFLLTMSSYYGTVVTDIFWIGEITVGDVISISKRLLPLPELGKYVAGQIGKIREFVSTVGRLYARRELPLEALPEALICWERKLYKAFNLLMITGIEGIARSFGEYLLEKQPAIPAIKKARKSHSLDAFFRTNCWAEDLPISKSQYIQVTGDYNFSDSMAFSRGAWPMKENLTISYPTRLGFLRREFKDRRNSLAHGGNVEYEDTVQALINAAALSEVLETILEYNRIYAD
jgi:hypothetical protein